MTPAQIFDEVNGLIHQHLDDPTTPISRSSHLAEELGLDSLTRVDLVVEIESAFDITVPDGDVRRLVRVGDIVDYVEEAVSK